MINRQFFSFRITVWEMKAKGNNRKSWSYPKSVLYTWLSYKVYFVIAFTMKQSICQSLNCSFNLLSLKVVVGPKLTLSQVSFSDFQLCQNTILFVCFRFHFFKIFFLRDDSKIIQISFRFDLSLMNFIYSLKACCYTV
jgi:hypothetical protein